MQIFILLNYRQFFFLIRLDSGLNFLVYLNVYKSMLSTLSKLFLKLYAFDLCMKKSCMHVTEWINSNHTFSVKPGNFSVNISSPNAYQFFLFMHDFLPFSTLRMCHPTWYIYIVLIPFSFKMHVFSFLIFPNKCLVVFQIQQILFMHTDSFLATQFIKILRNATLKKNWQL